VTAYERTTGVELDDAAARVRVDGRRGYAERAEQTQRDTGRKVKT
jgi:hypothetical protein